MDICARLLNKSLQQVLFCGPYQICTIFQPVDLFLSPSFFWILRASTDMHCHNNRDRKSLVLPMICCLHWSDNIFQEFNRCYIIAYCIDWLSIFQFHHVFSSIQLSVALGLKRKDRNCEFQKDCLLEIFSKFRKAYTDKWWYIYAYMHRKICWYNWFNFTISGLLLQIQVTSVA